MPIRVSEEQLREGERPGGSLGPRVLRLEMLAKKIIKIRKNGLLMNL